MTGDADRIMASTSHATKMTRHFCQGLIVTWRVHFQQQPSNQDDDEKADRGDEGGIEQHGAIHSTLAAQGD
jgi:hypothetical protein